MKVLLLGLVGLFKGGESQYHSDNHTLASQYNSTGYRGYNATEHGEYSRDSVNSTFHITNSEVNIHYNNRTSYPDHSSNNNTSYYNRTQGYGYYTPKKVYNASTYSVYPSATGVNDTKSNTYYYSRSPYVYSSYPGNKPSSSYAYYPRATLGYYSDSDYVRYNPSSTYAYYPRSSYAYNTGSSWASSSVPNYPRSTYDYHDYEDEDFEAINSPYSYTDYYRDDSRYTSYYSSEPSGSFGYAYPSVVSAQSGYYYPSSASEYRKAPQATEYFPKHHTTKSYYRDI